MRKKGKKGKKSAASKRGTEELERNARRLALSRELVMGDMNARQQRKAWREKMMSLQLPVIKEDLQVAWRTFDRALDNKNYSVSVLLDALDSADAQKRRNDALHMEQIDHILEINKQLLDENNGHYLTTVQSVLGITRDQMDEYEQDENEKQSFLQTLIFSTKQQFEQFMEITNTKNLSKLDTRKEENENEMRIGKTLLTRHLSYISEELASVLRNYKESTMDQRKDFKKVKEKDDKDQTKIAEQSMRIQNLYKTIQQLRNKINYLQEKANTEIADCKFERDYFHKAYITIQNRVHKEKIIDKTQLHVLTTEYNKTINYLNKYVVKLEKVLIMADLCKKYQTFNEEIILYPLSSANLEVDNSEIETVLYNENEFTVQIQLMQKFLKIILSVQKDIATLKCEYEELYCKSCELKNYLKFYMDKVSGPTLSKTNEDATTKPIIINLKDLIN